jgi:hypothetical protein
MRVSWKIIEKFILALVFEPSPKVAITLKEQTRILCEMKEILWGSRGLPWAASPSGGERGVTLIIS